MCFFASGFRLGGGGGIVVFNGNVIYGYLCASRFLARFLAYVRPGFSPQCASDEVAVGHIAGGRETEPENGEPENGTSLISMTVSRAR